MCCSTESRFDPCAPKSDTPASILIDTGAATSILNKDLRDKAKERESELRGMTGRKLVGVQGNPLTLYGRACIKMCLAGEVFPIELMVAETPTADLILGRNFLRNQECVIEMGKIDTLHVKSRALYLPISKDLSSSITPIMKVTVQEQVKVPPQSEMEVMGKVLPAASGKTWVMEGRSKSCDDCKSSSAT